MQRTDVVSFADAAVRWICRRENRLSASTERAYRGEIDRLAQFFAVKYGGLGLGEFTQEMWEDYLDELRGVRRHVVTCRKKPLSPASAGQAVRIATAFLRWARDDGLLAWTPKAVRGASGCSGSASMSRSPLVDLSADSEPMHPALETLLASPPAIGATLEELRAQLAVGLAYWAGLRTSEIAALRKDDLVINKAVVELRHPRRQSTASLGGNVATVWIQYQAAREDAGWVLTERSPVVAALGSDGPISAWSVWALIAQRVENVTGIEKHHSAQSLRRARIAAIGSKCAAEVDELAKYAHRANVDFLPSAPTAAG